MKSRTIVLVAVLGTIVLIAAFVCLVKFWWGATPTCQTVTPGGVEVTYKPHLFSSPTNPILGKIVAKDLNLKITLEISANRVSYADSSRINKAVDSCFTLIFRPEEINSLLPEGFNLAVVTAPEWYFHSTTAAPDDFVPAAAPAMPQTPCE
ncbi:TPA: hypothetical protein DCL28_05025 [Candidatus Komeilibacteria bacterium]|nr:MAG: hypothetical protein UW91_C0027G0019 [Parcubacteria group bacterium GW2011_GWF2_45_11]KKT96592.1 MAG: hypothetical protein UW98_C0039G0015 [Parcubacteria group bacterium GW2011_GWC2_45_15]OGY94328.1 MAG: hypothetical protein A3J95_00990 [Candidatus Komeilibacteria bacterium RIFOXYC2_FULL_45_12]HAH04886.1 hypothetical protein [Candidatus Komeilibacteria bacterium]HBV02258.1 hypothetical protein [Candidatus Komeilibacteria bacterium]